MKVGLRLPQTGKNGATKETSPYFINKMVYKELH